MWRRAWEAVQGLLAALALVAIAVTFAVAGILSRPWGPR